MAEEKRFILEMECNGIENFDGSCWIDEKEFKQMKSQGERDLNNGSTCRVTLKDAKGRFLFSKQVC